MSAISIAASGMSAATLRLTASAANIANGLTYGSKRPRTGSRPYRPLEVVQSPLPDGGVAAELRPDRSLPVPLPAPESPDADADGLVAAPAVNIAAETAEQISALAAYRANLAIIRAGWRSADRLLDALA